MKILLATPLYPPEAGGPATYAKLLETELPKRDIKIAILPFKSVRHLPKLFRHVAYFFKCIRRSWGVDVIYALDPVSVGLPAAVAALVTGKKFVLRVPGDYAWEQGRQRFGVTDELDEFQTRQYSWRVELLRSVQKFVARRADKIIVPSDYMQKLVSRWLVPSGVEGVNKVVRIYSSVHMPVEYEMPFDDAQGKPRPEGFLVVTAARRVPWKGIDALERVVAREKMWNFFLAEELPPKEAMGWIKAADVFVLNSTYEGLSHVLIEAMALGTPVIATNVGGNPELVANGSEGLIIPPKDDEALYAALKETEAHLEEARARAVRAQERAKEFSILVTIEKLVDLFKSI